MTDKKDTGWIGMAPGASARLRGRVQCIQTPPDQHVVGFHGRIGAIVDSIGVIYQPKLAFEELLAAFQQRVLEPVGVYFPPDLLAIIMLYIRKDLYNWDLIARPQGQ